MKLWLWIAFVFAVPVREASVTRATFGKTSAGQTVDVFTLANANGVEARIINYGAIVVSLRVPDRSGRFDDVVLGYDTLDGYTAGNPRFFGAVVGRYGNRIANGRFTLDVRTTHSRPTMARTTCRRRQGLRQSHLARGAVQKA
jgi:galactose mutarotase-like enzyme